MQLGKEFFIINKNSSQEEFIKNERKLKIINDKSV